MILRIAGQQLSVIDLCVHVPGTNLNSSQVSLTLEKLRLEVSHEQAAAMIQKVDKNKDGEMDFDEFYDFLQVSQPASQPADPSRDQGTAGVTGWRHGRMKGCTPGLRPLTRPRHC